LDNFLQRLGDFLATSSGHTVGKAPLAVYKGFKILIWFLLSKAYQNILRFSYLTTHLVDFKCLFW